MPTDPALCRKTLHERLVERQSLEELRRKMNKSMRRGFWTVELLDWAKRKAEDVAERIGWK